MEFSVSRTRKLAVSFYILVLVNCRMSRQGKSLKNGKVYPEILVIVDYNLFKEFSFSIPKARKYIISYFNAVNMRFKTFYQPKIELNIAGVIFGKSKSSFPFISSALSNGDMLDAPASLHAMGQYYYKDRYYQFIFYILVKAIIVNVRKSFPTFFFCTLSCCDLPFA